MSISDNILIAEFDGWKLKHNCTDRYVRKKLGGDGYNIVREDKFLYHDGSWNVIMPVVKKVFECSNVNFIPAFYYENLSNAVLAVDFEKTYIAVVEFIKWYNE